MSRDELIELAALDVYGLLDEYEAALYTRSFHHAPAAVQDEILRLQAELSSDSTLLPDDEPPAELRERVLRAVADSIEKDTVSHQPLATIGRRRESVKAIAGRVGPITAAGFWRAASFALLAASVVLAYFLSETNRQNEVLRQAATNNYVYDMLEQQIGPSVRPYVFSDNVEHLRLTSTDDSDRSGVILFNEEDGTAFLVTDRLPRSEFDEYELVIAYGDGTRRAIREFGSTGGYSGIELGRLAMSAIGTATVQVVNTVTGTVLLESV